MICRKTTKNIEYKRESKSIIIGALGTVPKHLEKRRLKSLAI